MDLLASLGLPDVPEQQTRLLLDAPDAVSLGFDACCTCGTRLGEQQEKHYCPHCRRVVYCSEQCRERDARGGGAEEDDPQPDALGHSAIICSLLQLCAADEAVEAQDGTTTTIVRGNTTASTTNAALFTTPQAARDRVRSEYESYPATLANVLMEGPCYQAAFAQKDMVVIHVIGASDDAELSSQATTAESVLQAYADSLAEWVDRHASVQQIVLQFVGPECPTEPSWNQELPLRLSDKRVGMLRVSCHCGLYHEQFDHLTTPPDIVVWFHPGFTVPDYDWVESLHCIPHGTPFLLTSNTEMEVIADTQFLLEQECIQQLPAGLADVLEVVVESSEQTFCTVNPFAGLRVRQNGSLANDVYVKNRWMLGGVVGPLVRPEASSQSTKRARNSSNKPNAALI